MIAASTRYAWVVLLLTFMAQFGNSLAAQSLPPLAPLFQPELGLSNAEVGLFSSATFIGAWAVLLMAGWLTDRLGVRKVMSFGVILTGTLILAMAWTSSFVQALAVMLLSGLGRGAIPPGATKAIMEWFRPSFRATAMGVKQTGAAVGGIITAASLPALGLALGWRFAMAAVGLFVLSVGVANAILYRDPRGPREARQGETGPRAELGKVMGNRRVWALSAVALLYFAVQFSATTYIALYFTEVLLVPLVADYPARVLAAGGCLALFQAGGVFGRIFWGLVSDRGIGGRRSVPMAIIGVLLATISALFAYLEPGYPLWMLGIASFVYGSLALGWNALQLSAVCEATGARLAACATGFTLTLSQVGIIAGPPLFGLMVDASGSFRPAWLCLAAVSTGGAALAALCASGEKQVG